MTPDYLVVHTAAFTGRNCDAGVIDRWHRQKGWSGVGYHYVIINDQHDSLADGAVQPGRATDQTGAHTKGLNSQSLGICCAGHGDINDFTAAQYLSLYKLLAELMHRFSIVPANVIGHREINKLVGRGLLDEQFKTSKSCPGNRVDMDAIRDTLQRQAAGDSATAAITGDDNSRDTHSDEELRAALTVLRESRSHFANAQDELNEFLYHPEVLEFSATGLP
jgi:N-acetyl-anhydromuramyl-L-alanine amidase AmpD